MDNPIVSLVMIFIAMLALLSIIPALTYGDYFSAGLAVVILCVIALMFSAAKKT